MLRSILHCDMNNFYASVECMRNPALVGHPVAVCGETEERHGIVLAKNYEAKACGVSTGEAVWQAKKKCPGLLIVPPHYEEYLRISDAARRIYGAFTDQIEPMGLDECWLDVTGSTRLFGSGEEMAYAIKERVKSELGVTVSVGVSFNKVFAKLGSDLKKPDAVTVIDADSFRERIWNLPAGEMLGVGRATGRKLNAMGIVTIGDLARASLPSLRGRLGKCGEDLWRAANGMDISRVIPRHIDDLDKTTGHGITTLRDLEHDEEVWPVLLELSQNVGHRLYRYDRRATGVALSVRDCSLISREWQTRLPYPTKSAMVIARTAFTLFVKSYSWHLPIRSLSVRAIDLVQGDAAFQLDLFTDVTDIDRRERIDFTVEAIRNRFGQRSIRNAVLLYSPKMPQSDVLMRN